ncbi:MAG TPA: SufD family Fe-S cluster assembly protein [Candidatus Thalassarchaeaceae archaeon]|nr:SufD family Fe-S cluster assembly protein [Candidatus Thalassarchaeaceae archaeon]
MSAESQYLSLEIPERSEHLWRYTPWKSVHPTGNLEEIPLSSAPNFNLYSLFDRKPIVGITIEKGVIETEGLPISDDFSSSFIRAMARSNEYTIHVENGFNSDEPVLIEINSGEKDCAIHLSLDIGRNCEFEIITQIIGSAPWTGLLRTGKFGEGSIVNDVVLGHKETGTLLRIDSILIGRDAQVKAGTISSGSKCTKSDLRYRMGETGGHLKVLGSILSTNDMHLDHHIEIQHDAPETFSRLNWHSVCGGNSRTIGTGMLRVANGSRGADAAQLFHNLLLSEKAEADSIPELEVSEHDVVGCGHGTANGPIDEEQLFYLETRGLNSEEARGAIIAAFLNSTLVEMGSKKMHHWLANYLQDELIDLKS